MQELALGARFDQQEEIIDPKIEFEQIYDQYYKRVYNFNYYRTKNQGVTEDLTSLVFEKVITKINTYDKNKSSFEVWLFAIARNNLNDYFRRQKRYPWESLDNVIEMSSNEYSPESKVIEDEEKIQLLKAVDKLKEKEKTIIAYKYGAGLKNKEIASLMKMKEKTIATRLYRILQKIRRNLEESEER